MDRRRKRRALYRLTDEILLRVSPLAPRPKTGLDLYCPHRPFPKQQAFLDLECREALFGGGAGPGKTDALLMAALQYAHVPGYSALILRRDYPRLSLPNSIMDRARQWLHSTNARWNSQTKTYRFPSGAVLQFGYIDNPEDRYRYASSEFAFIGWDELTEFRLGPGDDNPYEFMFSRLRKSASLPVPLRMRAASNPGNIGHEYVKRRFITDEALAALRDDRPQVFYADPENRDRAFVPALLADNPHLDREQYMANLMHLPPVSRARLLQGDWSIVEDAIIKPNWLSYYDVRGEMLVPLDKLRRNQNLAIDSRLCRRLASVDTAGTSRQKAEERQGPAAELVGLSDLGLLAEEQAVVPPLRLARPGELGRAQGRRSQDTAPMASAHDADRECPLRSAAAPGTGAEFRVQLVNPVTPSMRGQSGVPGKVERATPLLNKLESGEVFLPNGGAAWLVDLESEWLTWTGLEGEPADQIDAAAYVAGHTVAGGRELIIPGGKLFTGGWAAGSGW